MNPLVILAHRSTTKEVKRQLQAKGVRPTKIPFRELRRRADLYFAEHRQTLIEAAKETVRNVPELRTLYERNLHDRREIWNDCGRAEH